MPDMTIFLDALDLHLKDKGFHVHLTRPDEANGHRLRSQIADIRSSVGAHSECSAPIYVKNLLQAMTDCNVPEWTSDKARSALEAAGFDPHQYLNSAI